MRGLITYFFGLFLKGVTQPICCFDFDKWFIILCLVKKSSIKHCVRKDSTDFTFDSFCVGCCGLCRMCAGAWRMTQTATRLTMPTHPWQNECFITTELLVWRWGHRGVKHLCIWHFTRCCFNELGEGWFEGLLSLWCLHWITTTFFISILHLCFIYFKDMKYITRMWKWSVSSPEHYVLV